MYLLFLVFPQHIQSIDDGVFLAQTVNVITSTLSLYANSFLSFLLNQSMYIRLFTFPFSVKQRVNSEKVTYSSLGTLKGIIPLAAEARYLRRWTEAQVKIKQLIFESLTYFIPSLSLHSYPSQPFISNNAIYCINENPEKMESFAAVMMEKLSS